MSEEKHLTPLERDLLAALKLIRAWRYTDRKNTAEVWAAVDAAIAKAEGRS